jgi:hypothetical protein
MKALSLLVILGSLVSVSVFAEQSDSISKRCESDPCVPCCEAVYHAQEKAVIEPVNEVPVQKVNDAQKGQ